MSSDIKERLRVADVGEAFIGQHGVELVQTELGLEAADRIEALEAQAELNGGVAIEWKLKAEAAEARAERLRVALEEIASGRHSGVLLMSYPPQDPAVVRARKALEEEGL
jgi:hypothetical protein